MTPTGLLVIPLGLLIILLPWRYGLVALLVFATMDSAAVVNLGSFGLQPGYFFGLLVIVRTVVEITVFRTPLSARILGIMTPLFVFAIVSVVSIWIALTFFQGRIMVISSTAGLNLDLAQPYTFQRQNLTQPFYLFLNMAILYCVAHQIARLPLDTLGRTLDRAVLGATLFAAGVAIWEMANFYAGVPFAEAFFHSNAGYAKAHGQVVSGTILRASGPFTEPAALAYHFAGFLFFAWYRYLLRPSARAMAVVLVCLLVMASSTSTTAFAIIGLFVLVILKDAVTAAARATRDATSTVGLSSAHLSALVLVGLTAAGVTVFVQSHWPFVDDIVTRMIVQKSETSSFAQRTGVDLMALDIVMQTGGIGIGLGSHKPNNLAMTLLSNTGIAGFLAFGVFLFDILRSPAGTRRHAELRPLRWLLLGLLAVHAMANPNLSTFMLWIGFALIVGTRCSEERPLGVAPPVLAPETLEPADRVDRPATPRGMCA